MNLLLLFLFSFVISQFEIEDTHFQRVQLYIYSNNSDVNGLGLSSIHEGAGINYLQLGSGAQTLGYDNSLGLLYSPQSTSYGFNYNLTVSVVKNSANYNGFPYLQLSVINPNVSWGIYKLNGQHLLYARDSHGKFYVAKNTGDPYSVSTRAYLAGFGDSSIFESSVTNLTEVKIRVLGL